MSRQSEDSRRQAEKRAADYMKAADLLDEAWSFTAEHHENWSTCLYQFAGIMRRVAREEMTGSEVAS